LTLDESKGVTTQHLKLRLRDLSDTPGEAAASGGLVLDDEVVRTAR